MLDSKKLGRITFGTEDPNSMKCEIIHIHRGSGTLCNVANTLDAEEIKITFIMCQEML